MAAIIGGALSAAGSLGSGLLSYMGSNSLSSAYNTLGNYTADLYLAENDYLKNYRDYGGTADSRLADYYGVGPDTTWSTYGSFLNPISDTIGKPPDPSDTTLASKYTASPGYTYEVAAATDAVQNAASVKSGAVSSNALRDIGTKTAGYASTDYWKWYDALVKNWNNLYMDESDRRAGVNQGLGYLATGGQNAAVFTGNTGSKLLDTYGNALTGSVTSSNLGTSSLSTGITSAAKSLYGAYNDYYYPSGGDYGGGSDY